MGAFDLNKVLNKQGTIRTTTNNDILDMWGTIKGSTQFDNIRVVDMFGNLGNAAPPTPTGWEIQTPPDTFTPSTTGETLTANLGTNSTSYASAFSSYVPEGGTGITSGYNTGFWTVQAGPRYIGGVLQSGTGLLINNFWAAGGMTVKTGATVQFGIDLEALNGAAGGILTIENGATVNVLGANPLQGRYAVASLVNNGTLTFTGPNRCGAGYFGNQGDITNNGNIPIKDARLSFWNPITWGGTGSFEVFDGATLATSAATIPATQTLKINGCGKCNASNIKEGAILALGAGTIASPIEIQSDSCIKSDGNIKTYSGVISGSSKLTLGNSGDVTAYKYGVATFTNANNTFTGALDIVDTSLGNSDPLAFQYSDVNLIGRGEISSDKAMTFKSLRSDSPNAYIVSWNVPIILTDNGETTFAGLIGTSSTGHNAVTLDGVGEHLILTNTGNHSCGLRAINGAKFSQLGGGQIGKIDIENGSKYSIGKTRSSYINAGSATFTNNSSYEVYAVDPNLASRFGCFGAFNVTNGWKVDLMEPLAAGVQHNILYCVGGGTGVGVLPTIGVNNTGLTPTFSWSGGNLNVILN
jgi:hypothetical protein